MDGRCQWEEVPGEAVPGSVPGGRSIVEQDGKAQ